MPASSVAVALPRMPTPHSASEDSKPTSWLLYVHQL